MEPKGANLDVLAGKVFVVTGGAGYFGSRLCAELLARGAKEVRCFDWSVARVTPATALGDATPRLRLVQGDIRSREDVVAATRGADAVFHVASFGMSGKEMLQDRLVSTVNVDGTLLLLDACAQNRVPALVYTSTYNVVFGGVAIDGGDERVDYFPLGAHADCYARSKTIAEQLVLHSSGRHFDDGTGQLQTCAIRPAAIYGPGETRHFPRMMGCVRMGLVQFRIGSPGARVDWVHVSNLVHAHALAMASLLHPKETQAAGQAYFISDGAPMNNFEFLKPIFQAYGHAMPSLYVPVSAMLVVAWFTETVYRMLFLLMKYRWFPEPLILPAEVYKIGINHYFSFAKAQKELGYKPIVHVTEGVRQMQEHWSKVKDSQVPRPPGIACISTTLGMVLLALSAFIPRAHLPWPMQAVQNLGFIIFFNREILQIVFWMAVGIHVVEGLVAAYIAARVDRANSVEWFIQTCLFGFPSLRLLLKRMATKF